MSEPLRPSHPTASPADPAALRAEHDALAQKLAIRPSVDAARKGLILAFLGFIALGTAGALAWDHWGPPPPGEVKVVMPGRPLYFMIVLVVAIAIASWSVVILARARRLGREEAVLFGRMKQLRALLGLDT
jgi:hypothetical protein